MPLIANKTLRVNVSDDGLSAMLALHNEAMRTAIAADEIISELHAIEIVLNQDSEKVIHEFAQALEEKTIPEPIVVAKGIPPVNDKNGVIEKLFEQHDQQDKPKSHYDRSSIIPVSENQPLVKLHPPVTGKDGVDVFGKTIPRKLGREAEIKLGTNVRQEGDQVLANCSGCVEFSNNKIWVQSKLEIKGDVDFAVGNIDFSGDITIARNILDLFKVRSQGTIQVQGLIEAADVHADRDLFCSGGMAGKEKGHFSAGHDIRAKYITNANVTAGNDVQVRVEVVNCELNCKGTLIVEQGPLVGGHTVAARGIKVKQLGSEAGVKMLIEVGIDPAVRKMITDYAPLIDKKRQKSLKVKQAVEPLLANQKYLNDEQKEKATELLYQAYEIDDEVEKLLAELRKISKPTDQTLDSVIEVANCAYTGITMRFPLVETTLDTAISGPVKFIAQKIDHNLTVVAIDSTSGTAYPLKTNSSRDPMWATLNRLLVSPENQPPM